MGYEGVKTGITNIAGPCLSASFKEIDEFGEIIHLNVVVLSCFEKEYRFKDSKKLIDWAREEIKEKNRRNFKNF